MKEFPISFLVRLKPKHKRILQKFANLTNRSEAFIIRSAIEFLEEDNVDDEKDT